MRDDFRQSKYLNESGSKKGRWYINRLDYFEFHQYPAFKRHKFFSIAAFLAVFYFLGFANQFSGILWLLYVGVCSYVVYLSIVSWMILSRQLCKHRGYMFYPKRWLKFFKQLEKQTDLEDFDSTATMSNTRR